MRICIDYKPPAPPSTNPPHEVLTLWAASATNTPVGLDTYNNIYKFPEWFPEENEYKRRWDLIPMEIREEYSKVAHTLDWDRSDYPYPELEGLGIIGISEAMLIEENRPKIKANDEYREKKWKERLIKQKELFNKLFNEYGLKEL
jgi:hypothetical protein